MRAGLKRDSKLPTGTVTLLLADVESSTRLWERDEAEARAAMSEFDATVDELVTKFDGARPHDQGEGDSFLAAFARASDALNCALEMQRRLAEAPVRVRMGLHTGEVEVRDQDRYEGRTIIRAARIRDLAHGGQTLVSAATRDLVQDTLRGGADLIDLGSHRLKGLDRTEHIFQVTHPALAGRFPPLRSAETLKSNLPIRLTSFVGRTAEVAEVQKLIGENRMVTLTGAGGCGKTRLTVESIAPIEDAFGGGVWFCDLGPLADPSIVPQAVRTTVGVREDSTRSDTDVLCAHLGDADVLVVLDNCEHMIEACAALADALLRHCSRVRVVATTREPLGVEGEVAWRVPSLDAPDVGHATPDALTAFDSVRLFVERARSARPDFVLTSDNARAVAEICKRLDGIPLAIELAAARVRVLSVGQVAEGLHDRFRLLGRGARTVLARQQTLLASVGWSYDLLTEQQRVVLRRLSVFAGGCSLEGAEAVASGDGVDVAEVLELVSQLVDRSLLVAEETTWGTRYRMLETIRQFARDRLVDSKEAAHTSRRHLDWYAEWVLRLGHGAETGRRPAISAILEVEADYDNVRTAVEWALADGRHATGVRLLSALWHVIVTQKTDAGLREAAGWMERLLEAPDLEPVARAQGLLALSWVRAFQSDFVGSVAAAAEALPLVRDTDNPRLIARALLILGNSNAYFDADVGLEQLAECESLARASDDIVTLSICLFFLSVVRLFLGETVLAIRTAEEAERVAEAANNTVGLSQARYVRASGAAYQGRLDDATTVLERCVEEFDAMGNTYWTLTSTMALAQVAELRGDRAEAVRLNRRALEIGVQRGMGYVAGFVEPTLAFYAAGDGDVAEAERLLDRRSVTLPGMYGYVQHALTGCGRGFVAAVRGDISNALALTRESADHARSTPYASFRFVPLRFLARIARASGESKEAEDTVHELLALVVRTDSLVYAPDGLELAAALRGDVGADSDAVRLFAAAQRHRDEIGAARIADPTFDVDAEIAAVRERVEEEAFEAAWSEGSALGVKEAIEFALRGRGPRQRPQAGWDSLTPTELKVVALVAEGLSNPQVAEKLFISRRTVSTHLSHVFGKLGVSSRAELAVEATKRGT